MILRPAIFFLFFIISFHSMAVEAVFSHKVFYSSHDTKSKLAPAIEVYWQINPKSLHYITTPEKTIIAHIKTDIIFYNENSPVKEDHYILETVPRSNVTDLMNHSILELKKYALPPGFFKIKLILTDLADSTHPLTINDSLTIPEVLQKPFFSDLQLLDTIVESPGRTPFLKNGRQQVPAFVDFMDDDKRTLHYYTELYNLSKILSTDLPLIQKIAISRYAETNDMREFLKTDTVKAGDTKTIDGSFNIASLQSGNYYLRITVENNSRLIIASQTLFFQRLNKHPVEIAPDTAKNKPVSDTGLENVSVLNLKKTFVAKYSLGEIRGILKMLLPFSDALATQTIQGFLKKPDEVYMRYFVYNYFANINRKDPGKAFKEFSDRIIEVNKLFNTNSTRGYETERGFIYLRYGAPTEIITVENESGNHPYEIWQYNLLTQTNRKEITNALFLFYKPNEITSEYKLLHSTVTGESQNMDWRNYLYSASNGTSNSDSRAEQYFGNR